MHGKSLGYKMLAQDRKLKIHKNACPRELVTFENFLRSEYILHSSAREMILKWMCEMIKKRRKIRICFHFDAAAESFDVFFSIVALDLVIPRRIS